jgi:hypothetical protein
VAAYFVLLDWEELRRGRFYAGLALGLLLAASGWSRRPGR